MLTCGPPWGAGAAPPTRRRGGEHRRPRAVAALDCKGGATGGCPARAGGSSDHAVGCQWVFCATLGRPERGAGTVWMEGTLAGRAERGLPARARVTWPAFAVQKRTGCQHQSIRCRARRQGESPPRLGSRPPVVQWSVRRFPRRRTFRLVRQRGGQTPCSLRHAHSTDRSGQ